MRIGPGRGNGSIAFARLALLALSFPGSAALAQSEPSNLITYAGINGDGRAAIASQAGNPSRLAIDAAGNLYIADNGSARIRRVDAATKKISTVAGKLFSGFGGDGGPATAAMINGPHGLTLDRFGNLYIADTGNNRIRKVDTAGIITTVVGRSSTGAAPDSAATVASRRARS